MVPPELQAGSRPDHKSQGRYALGTTVGSLLAPPGPPRPGATEVEHSRHSSLRLPNNNHGVKKSRIGEEVNWAKIAGDPVFQLLMNDVGGNEESKVGEVKRFVAGRAIVGKELSC